MDTHKLFLQHVAQTSQSPLGIHIKKAKGSLLWDESGKEYIDLIAGISVCNIGHRNRQVIDAIKEQAEKYLHVLVYGEMIETPQVKYAKLLTDNLPPTLNSVYFTNSGAEAVEGAMKLAKRHTNRTEIIAFNKSYHGSTQGALSIMGDEYFRNSFRPLLPSVFHFDFDTYEVINAITERTACVVLETVQAERGIFLPSPAWLQELRRKCTETGTLLILDEIQVGFGRTGTLWGFKKFDIVPDILLLGKALGGGMPLGAFIAEKELMDDLSHDPVLGHITTFGGHPVCCAAGVAALEVLLKKDIISKIPKKEKLFKKLLQHPAIKEVRTAGLLIAVEFPDEEMNKRVINHCVENGVLTDWFLFAPQCMRIAPPLTISTKEIQKACDVIINGIDGIYYS